MKNAKRLIDANALKQYATGGVTSVGILTLAEIDEAPTVDAVEVVRCKDCKHWRREYEWMPHECSIFNGCYETTGYPTGPDDFCSYGERKENEA